MAFFGSLFESLIIFFLRWGKIVLKCTNTKVLNWISLPFGSLFCRRASLHTTHTDSQLNLILVETLTRDSDRSVVAWDWSFTESHHFSQADSYTPNNDVEQQNNRSVEVSHRRTCWVIHQTPIPVRWGTEIHLRNRHFLNPNPKHRSYHHRLIQAAGVMKHICPSQTHYTQSHARVLYTTLQCLEFQDSDPLLQHYDRSLLLMSLINLLDIGQH